VWRAKELWRVAPEFLDQAQDDATLLAIREQERAGLDIITDGEIRRESYSNRFATALEGRGHRQSRHRVRSLRPSQSGAAHHRQVCGASIRSRCATSNSFRKNTERMIKMTVPGPLHHVAAGAKNDFYTDEEEMVFDYAAAVNAEIKDLFAAGADVVQIDEPYMQARAGESAENMASRRSMRHSMELRARGGRGSPVTARDCRPPPRRSRGMVQAIAASSAALGVVSPIKSPDSLNA